MSNDVALEATGPRRTKSQLARTERLLDAATEILRESSYAELAVRDVAARAGVSTATAYNYFASKNGLIAAIYLRRVREVPIFVDVNQSTQSRVIQQMHALTVLLAHEPPSVAAATTAALMSDGPEMSDLKEEIGIEVRRRIAAALGPGQWPVLFSALEMVFYGALVRAATSRLTYGDAADRLDDVVGLIFSGVHAA
jgi:AcrR family transcriptional regulator